jgi:hypothetical protein
LVIILLEITNIELKDLKITSSEMERRKKKFIKEKDTITKLGDKFYTMDSDVLLNKKLIAFNEGELRLDTVLLTKQYIDSHGTQIRL